MATQELPPVMLDLYTKRDILRRELEGVEYRIENCHCSWVYTPETKFEDRGGSWAKVSFRTCSKCGLVCERVVFKPRESLGEWRRLAKYQKPVPDDILPGPG